MTLSRRGLLALGLVALVAGCGGRRERASGRRDAAPDIPRDLDRMIGRAARENDVPVALVHRVVRRESGYNPRARNGPYYGLMQIHPQTARTMGYRGAPEGLLDPETNLRYAVRYLRGAYIVADGDHDAAVRWYARGYYYEAKRRGLLEETGLRG
jgi:soluble lytic murein transglycosylase-like protein